MNKKENIKKVSSPRNVVGDLPLIKSLYKEVFSLLKTTKSAEDSPQRHWGMTLCYAQHAFTLIELLVVVLIIGILAAIALPQYQKAVDKTRLMKLIAMTRSVIEAEEVYYLENGTYTKDWDALAVTLPGTVNATSKNIMEVPGDWKVRLHVSSDGAGTANGLTAFDDKLGNELLIYGFYEHNGPANWQGTMACYAKTGNDRAINLCKQVTNNQNASSGAKFYYVIANDIG